MRNKTRFFGTYLPFFILILLGAITLRTIALMTSFNYEYQYFTAKTLPTIADALMAVLNFSFIIYIIGTKKKVSLIPNFSSPANYIPSAALSASLFFIATHFVRELINGSTVNLLIVLLAVFFAFSVVVFSFYLLFKAIFTKSENAKNATLIATAVTIFFLYFKYLRQGTVFEQSDVVNTVLVLGIIVFAVLSIVYLLFNTIFVRTVSARRAIFGLSIIIFISLYLLHLYLDSKTPLNSKIKAVDMLAYAFSAVFFLYEVRLSLGREKWRSYIIFGFIAATLTAYSSIPALIVYFSNDKLLAGTVYEIILTLTIFIFAFAKILLADTLTDAGESPFITKLKAAAANLEANLTPIATYAEETEGEEVPKNQISILDASTNENSAEVSEESISAEISTDTEEPLQ